MILCRPPVLGPIPSQLLARGTSLTVQAEPAHATIMLYEWCDFNFGDAQESTRADLYVMLFEWITGASSCHPEQVARLSAPRFWGSFAGVVPPGGHPYQSKQPVSSRPSGRS